MLRIDDNTPMGARPFENQHIIMPAITDVVLAGEKLRQLLGHLADSLMPKAVLTLNNDSRHAELPTAGFKYTDYNSYAHLGAVENRHRVTRT